MAVDVPELGQLGAGQDEQVLGDGQVVDVHHPQLRVVIAQVQHGGDIARVAVLEGHDAVGGVPSPDGLEDLVPRRVAHCLRVGEERPQRDVGKSTLHALIGGAVLAQHLRLVLLGDVHHVLDVISVVGPEGGILNAGRSLFQHHRLPCGVIDRQAVGLLVLGDAEHGGHPPLKQGGQLRIHRVDLSAGLFQCVHLFHILRVKFQLLLGRYLVSIP